MGPMAETTNCSHTLFPHFLGHTSPLQLGVVIITEFYQLYVNTVIIATSRLTQKDHFLHALSSSAVQVQQIQEDLGPLRRAEPQYGRSLGP